LLINIRIVGLGAIGTYLAQELSYANHQIIGLDFRIPSGTKEVIFNTQVNNIKKDLKLKITSTIYQDDDIIIIALKSYQLNETIMLKLFESSAELIFLQNGLLTKSKLQNRSLKVSIGTVTGVQATLKDTFLNASLMNSKIVLELQGDCKKIKELIQVTKMQNSVFIDSINSQIMIYEKFIRWVVASSLNILFDSSLGNCLTRVSSRELNLAISELTTFVEQKFKINVDQANVLKAIYDLPKELKTSSYFDFKQDFQSEIALELESVVNYLTNRNFKCVVLSEWREAIGIYG
jgi:ketopantoate reductase